MDVYEVVEKLIGVDMDVYEVVEKLIGPVSPVGETHTDNARFENLKELIELTDRLLVKFRAVHT